VEGVASAKKERIRPSMAEVAADLEVEDGLPRLMISEVEAVDHSEANTRPYRTQALRGAPVAAAVAAVSVAPLA